MDNGWRGVAKRSVDGIENPYRDTPVSQRGPDGWQLERGESCLAERDSRTARRGDYFRRRKDGLPGRRGRRHVTARHLRSFSMRILKGLIGFFRRVIPISTDFVRRPSSSEYQNQQLATHPFL